MNADLKAYDGDDFCLKFEHLTLMSLDGVVKDDFLCVCVFYVF